MGKGIGVYIGRNEVIAVSAIRTVTGPQIAAFAIESINPEGSQEPVIGKEAQRIKKTSPESRAILKALEKIKEPGAFVNVAVSPLQVVTRHFIMPVVPKKDEPGAVRNEASRYVPFKISDSSLDYHSHLTHKNVLSVTATAIRGEVLDTYLEDLRSAAAKVLVVEPVYNAVGRAFAALNMVGKTKTHGFVVLQSDGNVNVTLASKGIVYLSRDFILSGKMEEDKRRFHDELKASMDYFYKLTGGEAIGQIFLAGSGDLKLWVEYLEHAFNYTVRFDVASLPNAKNIPPETLHAVLVAFGLALRSLRYRSPMGDIQLLPKTERRSDLPQLLKFLGLECFLIFILLAGVRYGGFQPYLMHLEGQNEAILGPANQEFPAFASRSTEDLTSEKEKMSERAGQLNGFFGDKVSTSAFIMSLGQGLPQSISLDYVSLEDTTGKEMPQTGKRKRRLNARGICYLGNAEKETETISAWVKALSGKKIIADSFTEIKLEEIKRESFRNRDLTRFRVLGE
ncbi:MAG: pilus assembly protein PilM [Candidatus Omnitrophota bacterium]